MIYTYYIISIYFISRQCYNFNRKVSAFNTSDNINKCMYSKGGIIL